MKMNRENIEGLLSFHIDVFEDARGYFFEQFNEARYQEVGLKAHFVQDNFSWSRKNTLRGLHYQVNKPQGKLVQVVQGEIFDVAVDLRKDSKTFGKWIGKYLSQRNSVQFYLPPGFAHGFYVLSDSALVLYKCTDFYSPADERGILWNDESLNIEWPLIGSPIIAKKDLSLSKFSKLNWEEKIV